MHPVEMVALVLVFGLSWLMTTIILPRAIARNLKRGFLDSPGGRKDQAAPVPYGAGFAFYLTVVMILGLGLFIALLFHLGWMNLPERLALHLPGVWSKKRALIALILSSTLMWYMGRRDDRIGLPVWSRLALQFAVALAVVSSGVRLTLFIENAWLGAALSVTWLVFVTNCFNFVDNMDGLLPGLVFIAALILGALTYLDGQLFVATFAAIIAGSMLAILKKNEAPAEVYMGDEGSMLCGFLMGSLTMLASYQRAEDGVTWMPFLLPFVALAVPIADGVYVVTTRLLRGASPFQAGHDHLSHRLVEKGANRVQAVARLRAAAYFFGAAAFMQLGSWPARIIGFLLLLAGIRLIYEAKRRATP